MMHVNVVLQWLRSLPFVPIPTSLVELTVKIMFMLVLAFTFKIGELQDLSCEVRFHQVMLQLSWFMFPIL